MEYRRTLHIQPHILADRPTAFNMLKQVRPVVSSTSGSPLTSSDFPGLNNQEHVVRNVTPPETSMKHIATGEILKSGK